METDEMELDTLGDRKTALFVIISDTDDTFNFVVSILYTQLFNLLCDKADDVYGGRLPVHVRCLLDEFANIGQIPKFEKLIATIRSREISASIILQSQSQLKAIYKDNADTIVGNCDTTLFLGGKEKTTLKEMSEILGKETIDSFNTSENRGREVSHGLNYQKLGKQLMTEDEIAVMDGGKCILQLRGVRPFFSDKYDITKHPNYKYLSDYDKKNTFDIVGFSAWKNTFKRNVMKGQKGIKILAPSPYTVKKEIEKIDPLTQKPVIGKDGKPVTEEKEITIPAFKVVSVFDVSQTEGKELPNIAVDTLTGNVELYEDFFKALKETSPVPIAFEKIEGGAHGYYHLEDKRIAIDEGMSELQTIKTAIHEIAHAKLHDIDLTSPMDGQNRVDRRTREVEAESVAYTVCQHYGLDTSDYSFGYVAGWSSGRELAELKSSLETIRSAAAEIINSIDGKLAEIQKAQDKEQAPKEQTAEPDRDTYSIYQLKRDEATQDLRFEPYDRLIATGHEVDRANYDLVYTAPLTEDMTLNTIWEKFNIDHPKDFKGHSLSVSDIVVLHQNGGDTAHYVDSIGYQQVPEFLKKHTPLIPDEHLTGEKIRTPRGSFSLTDMTAEQMKEAGYGLHHTSDDGKYHIMGNGTRAFAIAAEPPEKTNPLKHIEDTVEQNDNNFDGIINNTPQTPTVGELEQKVKAGEPISLVDLANAMKAEKAQGKEKSKTPARREEKPSIREQLKKAKETAAPKKAAKQKNHDLEV